MDVTTAAPDAHQPEQEPAAGPQHGQDIEQVWRHLLSEVQCGGLCLAEALKAGKTTLKEQVALCQARERFAEALRACQQAIALSLETSPDAYLDSLRQDAGGTQEVQQQQQQPAAPAAEPQQQAAQAEEQPQQPAAAEDADGGGAGQQQEQQQLGQELPPQGAAEAAATAAAPAAPAEEPRVGT